MKYIALLLLTTFSLSAYVPNVDVTVSHRKMQILPEVMQKLDRVEQYKGDKEEEFRGDLVAVLSNGSKWKVHPLCESEFRTWRTEDTVRPVLRSDWYWFKREHKFALYNMRNGRSVNVMLVKRTKNPVYIVDTKTYAKDIRPKYTTQVEYTANGTPIYNRTYEGDHLTNWRKKITLSNGLSFVIKDNFSEFNSGSKVYVTSQGEQRFGYYDFVLIRGFERDAVWTWARITKDSLHRR